MSLSTNLISGLSSGFDWRSMIDQLMAIEYKRVDIVENRKSEYESKLSEWQSFNTKLLALKTASEGLKDPEDFYLYIASMSTDSSTVDGDDRLSVSTSDTAVPGTYEIVVTDLATAQKLSSNPFTSQTAELGSSYAGDIIINGKALIISATDSLADVAYNINSLNTGSDPSGVSATVINYGANDYRLILTSDDTGEDGMSLLNGSSADLVQKFGWKDNETAIINNSITNGAQSDRFTSHTTAIESLLGLTTEDRTSTGTLTIGGTAVTINLSTMSLTDVKTAINDAAIAGVTASVVSQTEDGNTYYRLQIDGTQTFVDEKNILNTLGVFDHNSADVTGKVSGKSMTSEGTYITSTTLLKDIDAYNTFTSGGSPSGDYITLTGTDTGGLDIGSVNFDISSSTTVQDLLNEIETNYGDVIAYVTSDGKIRVDDLTGGENLTVKLTDHIHDTNSKLEFVDADGFFGAASARKREVIAGEDATIEIDGVEVTNSSNIIDNVIEGVTLNLVGEDAPGTPITITLKIEHDIDTIKANIQDFVDKYNTVMTYINTQFSYDEDSETTGGILFGDGTLSSVKSDLTSALTNKIWGVDSDFSVLTLVGINNEFIDEDEDGDEEWILTIDDTKLTGYLQTNFNDVMSLFVAQGVTSTSTLSYIGHSRDSEADTYTVHIDTAATRGTETGNVDLVASGIANDVTIKITQGNSVATVDITSLTELSDIKNAINTELDTEYTETLVGSVELYSDVGLTTKITSETKWNSIYDGGGKVNFSDNDVISFSGTTRSGAGISESYTITNVATDTVQGFLSAIEDTFSSDVNATIDTLGRIVITDKYAGYSQLSIDSISHPVEDAFFGTVLTTNTDGQEGRYAMAITATDDGSNHLVLRSDDYGSTSFTISQVSDPSGTNKEVVIGSEANTDGGNITSGTFLADIDGATVVTGDTIKINGTDHDGTSITEYVFTIDTAVSTKNGVDDLLTAIETAFGGNVTASVVDGKIQIEDDITGVSLLTVTLTPNSTNLDFGTLASVNTGLINGTVTGVDVVGTIGGEAATGSGRVLAGNDGNTNTDGLSIRYSGTDNDTDVGTITLTLGVAELFERALYNITDSIDGYTAFKQTSLQNSIDSFETQIENMEARLNRKMETMINRFVAMELALAKIQNQSQWLTAQIGASYSGWV